MVKTNSITLGTKQYQCPAKWEEMESYHLLVWMRIIVKEIDRTHAFALAVMLFYRIPKTVFFRITAAQLVQLKNTLGFLAEGNKLVKWIIPYVKPYFWKKKYYGPSDRLASSSIQEFRYAEMYYLAFQKTKEDRFLDQLIATLYRRKGSNTLKLDCREQISQLLINTNAANMQKLDKALRMAIVFNYEGCRRYIFEKYPTVFKTSSTESTSNTLPDLEGIIKTVAGGKFGTFRETEGTALYIFLNHLADEIKNSKS